MRLCGVMVPAACGVGQGVQTAKGCWSGTRGHRERVCGGRLPGIQ